MKTAFLLGAGLSMAMALPAFACPAAGSNTQPDAMYQQGSMNQAAPMGQQSNAAPAAARRLHRQLLQAGFSDIQIRPNSFLVHARAPNGEAVRMVIGPDAIALATVSPQSSGNNGSGPQGNGSWNSTPDPRGNGMMAQR